MRLKKISLQGFRSFSSAQSLDISKLPPGLYHVAGLNQVEPDLEANGAGKSSLFEAIYWGSYGHTSRGVRAGALKNWTSKERCLVTTEWDGPLSVTRSWQPNTLEVSNGTKNRPTTQEEVDGLLGMGDTAFLHSVYFAQFAPTFIDLAPAEQTTLFSSVLSLSLWEKAAEKANLEVKSSEQALQFMREERASLLGQAEELMKQDFTGAEHRWQKDQDKEISKIRGEIALAAIEKTKQEQAIEKATRGVKEFRAKQDKVKANEVEIGLAERKERELADEITNLEVKNYKTCPMCGAPVNNEHIKKELLRLRAALRAAEAATTEVLRNHDVLLQHTAEHKHAEKAMVEAERGLATISAQLEQLKRKLNEKRIETNPYTTMRQEADNRGEVLATQTEELSSKIDSAERIAAAAQFWTKGFKEIRLSLIHTCLAQLTVEANEALYQLGLADWALEFDIERETTTGGISRAFDTLVRAPHASGRVPWAAWSGGESQRLREACALGFSNLVSAQTGAQPNFELWDEPSTALSENGIISLMEVLAERARRYQRVILIADHRALDFGGFSGTITIVKDSTGSHIQL